MAMSTRILLLSSLLAQPLQTNAHVSGLSGAGHNAMQLLKMLQKRGMGTTAFRGGGAPEMLGEELPRTETFDLSGRGGRFETPSRGSSSSLESLMHEGLNSLASLMSAPTGPGGSGPTPMQMVHQLSGDCVQVPGLVKEGWELTECQSSAQEILDVAKWFVYSLVMTRASGSGEMVAPGDLFTKVHNMTVRTCEQKECKDLMTKGVEQAVKCEFTAICAMSSSTMPMEVCQDAIGNYVKAITDNQAHACEKEPGTGTYCQEVMSENLMFLHPDCWLEMNHQYEGCSPKCKKVWSRIRLSYPHCSMQLATEVVHLQNSAINLVRKFGGGNVPLPAARSPDEICTDLSYHMHQDFSNYQKYVPSRQDYAKYMSKYASAAPAPAPVPLMSSQQGSDYEKYMAARQAAEKYMADYQKYMVPQQAHDYSKYVPAGYKPAAPAPAPVPLMSPQQAPSVASFHV